MAFYAWNLRVVEDLVEISEMCVCPEEGLEEVGSDGDHQLVGGFWLTLAGMEKGLGKGGETGAEFGFCERNIP